MFEHAPRVGLEQFTAWMFWGVFLLKKESLRAHCLVELVPAILGKPAGATPRGHKAQGSVGCAFYEMRSKRKYPGCQRGEKHERQGDQLGTY